MTDWAIPQQAKLKYTQLFNQHDRSRSGFLSGLQCRDILLHSGLPRNVLAEIWNLSDIDSDGQLTREEFILAMYLTNNAMAGQPLPSELTPELVPPSYRRARSTSATSIHSATSASSLGGGQTNDDKLSQKSDNLSGSQVSGSILTTNSFEDKRRENFEKGKAELERRRMKIVEQQMAVLKDQLTSSKKEVADAKAKIDSMRTERDTKMGLITSLDAQLKTFKDRMAYLSQEEQNLIAIAKDLNLVNPSQAELDNLATQAKQQSINLMKDKIKEYSLEKEKKTGELQQANERLGDSKRELEKVSIQVREAYEKYKERVSEAKIKREQFVEESKSRGPDLDSVWDSQSAFGPTSLHESVVPKSADITQTVDDPWAPSTADSAFKSTFPATSNELDQAFSGPANLVTKIGQPQSSDVGGGFGEDKFALQEPPLVKKYKVLYAFSATYPDELDLTPGDTITGIEHVCEPGWLMGEVNGKKGLFPETYVEELVNGDPFAASTSTLNDPMKSASSMFPTSDKEPDNAFSVELKTANKIGASDFNDLGAKSEQTQTGPKISSGKKYRAIYEFNAREKDELDLSPGDIIMGTDQVCEAGWLIGELNGKRGLFPETYVELIQSTPVNEPIPDANNEATNNNNMANKQQFELTSQKSKNTKKAEVGTVIANYKALGQEQLNLEKGQLVLIRRKMDSGWWEGEVQVKGKKKQFGWFPASYVKLLSKSANSSAPNQSAQ